MHNRLRLSVFESPFRHKIWFQSAKIVRPFEDDDQQSNTIEIMPILSSHSHVYISPLMNYEEEIEKLKVKDLVDVANKYFSKSNSTTMILKKSEEKE